MAGFGGFGRRRGTGTSAGTAAPSGGTANIKIVRDNTGRYWIVDFSTMTRHELGGPQTGSFAAAIKLYGHPLTSVDDLPQALRDRQRGMFPEVGGAIALDLRLGFKQGPASLELFGGPNGIERVVAGLEVDPLTGRRVESPETIISASGEPFSPTPGAAPATPKDAFADIRETLAAIGLESLVDPLIAHVKLNGAMSEAQLSAWLRDRDEFAARFPSLAEGVTLTAGGTLAGEVQAILAYERGAGELFSRTGVDRFLAPDEAVLRATVAEAIVGGLSFDELQSRVTGVFSAVRNAPAEVRQAFADFFGPQGDAALAAFVIDPDRSEAHLLRAVDIAEVAGAASQQGFRVGRRRAGELVSEGVTDFGQAQAGFRQAAGLRPLTRETISEVTDLTEGEAIDVAFGRSPEADELFRRRLEERRAAFAGGGGALVTSEGVVGLGSAR